MALRKTRIILLIWALLVAVIGPVQAASAAEEISNLVLNKNDISLEVGGTASLTGTAVYVSGTTETVTVKTDWNSGDTSIATVYNGVVTAKGEGKTVITATYMGKTVIVNVKVTKHVRSLIKDTQKIDLRQDQSTQVSLTAYYDDGTSENVTNKAEWNIDNGSVATVVDGLVTGQSSGTAIVTAKFNNQSVSIPVNIEIVKRVDPDKKSVTLLLQDSETIKLMATYPDGTIEDVSDKADWESDDTTIADVIKGKITGYGPGKATVTASYGTKSTTIEVEVDHAIKLTLDKQELLLKKNGTDQLKLTATYANGNSEEITDRAEWSSSKEDVVYVVKGKLVANSSGEATITAKYGDKSVSATVDVDVPLRLEAASDVLYLQAGKSEQLTIEATYADGTKEDVTSSAAWSTDKDAIASVIKGKVTAYKAGQALVTASYGGKTTAIQISVDIPNTIVPSKKTVSFQVGGYEQITLKALYADGREETVTSQAEWTSTAEAVAEVRSGLITGVGTGAATVKAAYGTRTTTIQVSVGVLKSLTTTVATQLALGKGSKQTLDLTATYTDGTTKDVLKDAVWTSTNSKAVTVEDGVLTAVASGEAVVTGSFENKTVTITVQVDLASTLKANPPFLYFDLGENKSIVLTATDATGQSRDVSKDAEWTSSAVTIAQVAEGVVTPISRGKATITAKYGSKTVTIPVEIGVVQSLEVDKKYVTAKSGQSVQVHLYATLSDGTKKDVSESATWKSSSYKVADVTDGLITATGAGTATITASFGGKSVSIPVENDKLKYLKTDLINVAMEVGATIEVKAVATYEDQTEENVSVAGLWTSSNIRVVDVKDGVIKATGKGSATVTVTFAKKKTSVYVTVR